jgi:hypothetical protein
MLASMSYHDHLSGISKAMIDVRGSALTALDDHFYISSSLRHEASKSSQFSDHLFTDSLQSDYFEIGKEV